MNIIVCVKPVPDPEKYNLLQLDPKTKRLVREGIPQVVNPSDKNAVELALQLKEKHGGKVTIVSMAPPFATEKLKECLAMGADEAYLLSDREFGGADTYSTSYTIMKGIEKAGLEYDLILAGNESADGATSHVPSQLGEWLDLPHVSNVSNVEVVGDKAVKLSKKIENGVVNYEVELPAVLAVERNSNTPRLVSAMGIIKAGKKPIEIYGKADIPDIDDSKLGLPGSPTQPGELFVPDLKRNATPIEGDVDEIAGQIVALIKKAAGGIA